MKRCCCLRPPAGALPVLLLLLLASGCGELRPRDPPDGPRVTYVDDIAPLLALRCVGCHGPQRAEGDYRLDSWRAVFGPGVDLVRNVIAGAADSELLVALGRPSHADVCSPAERTLLQRWVVEEEAAYSWPHTHAIPWLDLTQRSSRNFHGGDLRRRGWRFDACRDCHGQDLRGGTSGKSCYTCHADGPLGCSTCHGGLVGTLGLPFPDLAGRLDSPGARAHLAHRRPRAATSVPCSECHAVPSSAWAPGHLFDDAAGLTTDLRAEVVLGLRAHLGGALGTFVRAPDSGGVCSVYCHGTTLGTQSGDNIRPSWQAGRSTDCNSCHAAPMKGIGGAQCAHCHQQTVRACTPGEGGCLEVADGVGVRFRSPILHIDGRAQVGIAGQENTCWGCHGSEATAGAPAPDLDGSFDESRASVGLHAKHLGGSTLRVAMPCSTCHRVPRTRDEPGHIDSARPAEVIFDDLASGRKRDPNTTVVAVYDPKTKTCRNVYCHSRPNGEVGPEWPWNKRIPGGLNCASCHKGHASYPITYCVVCHPAAFKDGHINPVTHMNGTLDHY